MTPSPPPKPRKGDSSIDSTVLAPRPAFTDEGDSEGGSVFDADDPTGEPLEALRTHTMKKPNVRTVSSTADVSVIEAKELRPAASDSNFGFDIARTNASEADDGILFDEGYSPATEVLRLAFSGDGDSVTPSAPVAERIIPEAPVEVRKWRAGGGARPPVPPEAGQPPAAAQPPPPPPSMAMGTRIDLVTPPGRAAAAPLDVVELRRTLEEAEKLLRTVKHQASSLDLDLVAPGARGMNAQLAAALHRLGEALAMLGK